MLEEKSTQTVWLAVIGKALAYLCLKQDGGDNRSVLERAQFLEGLGLNRNDAAAILGTTAASISELSRRAKQKKGGARGGAKRKSGRR